MITKEEETLIKAIELRADEPITNIAKQVGQKVPTVRRRLSRLRELGVIGAKRAYVNLYPLGYVNYIVYFSISSEKGSEKLIEFLKQESKITWLCEVGGDFQFGVSVAAKSPIAFSSFIDRLSKSCVIYDKILSIRLSITTLPREYLGSKKIIKKNLFQGYTEVVKIDRTDEEIIELVAKQQDSSDRELSRALSIPLSTFHRRLKALETNKIVTGYQYLFEPKKINISSYRFLLETRSSGSRIRKELMIFSKSHLNIHKFIECIGAWDYELEVDVRDSREIGAIRSELIDSFAQQLARVRVVPLIQNIPMSVSFSL